mgnify:CR=1 FL=1
MFKIQTQSHALVEHQFHKEVAKPSARDLLKERSGQENFKSIDPWLRSRVDVNEAIKNSRQYKKDYERTLPEKLSPQTQNEMWKRAKYLKDEFTPGMLSRDELHPVKGFESNGTVKYVVDEERMRATRSVEREVAWQKKNDGKIKEFKNLMRHLNPDDPNAGDVEKFRPNKTGIR